MGEGVGVQHPLAMVLGRREQQVVGRQRLLRGSRDRAEIDAVEGRFRRRVESRAVDEFEHVLLVGVLGHEQFPAAVSNQEMKVIIW